MLDTEIKRKMIGRWKHNSPSRTPQQKEMLAKFIPALRGISADTNLTDILGDVVPSLDSWDLQDRADKLAFELQGFYRAVMSCFGAATCPFPEYVKKICVAEATMLQKELFGPLDSYPMETVSQAATVKKLILSRLDERIKNHKGRLAAQMVRDCKKYSPAEVTARDMVDVASRALLVQDAMSRKYDAIESALAKAQERLRADFLFE
jgi:hypothetical protein